MEKISKLSGIVRNFWLPIVLLLILSPMAFSGTHIMLDAESPDGLIETPTQLETSTDGFLLIILDGVGEEILLEENTKRLLNHNRENIATMHLNTGPLTLSATCVSELMTGVPNSPIDGLKNFNLEHPGGDDPWTLSAKDERYSVGMVGSYVMGNMYGDMEDIDFINTFEGHSDYYEGDNATSEVVIEWLENEDHNVISAHFSGPDKVGHRWGITGPEYEHKIRDVSITISKVLQKVPQSWTVVVTADHGMTDIGSHGSAEEVTRKVAALISGPGIIEGADTSGHQRDIPAFMTTVLGLEFPIQLHGRVPVDILNVEDDERDIIEWWNWEAAYQRQIFVNNENGFEDDELKLEEKDWSKISIEGVFTRNSDIALSITNWTLMILFSLIALSPVIKGDSRDIQTILLYCAIITTFIVSHASLSYSAMIPRGLGAACIVWLVAWSLRLSPKSEDDGDENKFTKIINYSNIFFEKPWPWAILVGLLFITLGTVTQAILVGSMFWVILWSIAAGSKQLEKAPFNLPEYSPWLLALVTVTFGSIRLWFALIPFLFIILKIVIRLTKTGAAKIERLPMFTLFTLITLAILLVHRRLFGTHLMLDLVEMGWPDNLTNGAISSLLLIGSALISTICMEKKLDTKKAFMLSAWLLGGLFTLGVASTILDRIMLFLILVMYIFSAISLKQVFNFKLPKGLALAALSAHMLLTWGAWAAAITLVLISCLEYLWSHFKEQMNFDKIDFNNPRPAIALAVLPWVVWILWWTLLGQVNGIQTCFEGICPHPRELDLGAVIVKGGYVGARDSPSVWWMTMMIASPIIIASTMMLYNLTKIGMSLRPYISTQILLILGCMSILAFSPQYPRLIFGLTWNIVFALLQISFALLAAAVLRLHSYKSENNSTLA